MGKRALDEQLMRSQISTNPFLPAHQSTNPFIDDTYNFNSTNPFVKNYDCDKSVILFDNTQSNQFSSTVLRQSPKPLNCVNIPFDSNYGSDADSDNVSVMYTVDTTFADLSRTQRELTIKVDNMMQALQKLKALELTSLE
jgi:hypothetical protein